MSLEVLKDKLAELAEVRTPTLPMPIMVQESFTLWQFLSEPRILAELVRVGQPPDLADDLAVRITAAREAQSWWMNTRDRTKSTQFVQSEQQALELRTDLMAACRYNLRNDREALSTLAAINKGEGVADLIQDLFDLATLMEKRHEVFETDQSFDVSVRVTEARELAEQLAADASDDHLDPMPATTRDQRDRAFTYLDQLVSDIREAGRYAFRKQSAVRKRFASDYLRKKRRRATRGQASDVVDLGDDGAAPALAGNIANDGESATGS